ncbi:MAG: hypothetical protein QXP39_00670 [Candidatus Aenigmatarchaeota archaeon]
MKKQEIKSQEIKSLYEQWYKEHVSGDDDRGLYGIVYLYSKQNFREKIKGIADNTIPGQGQYINDEMDKFLKEIERVAKKLGHVKNAEYISQAIKKIENDD